MSTPKPPTGTMTFAVVRPYPSYIRKQVFTFLSSMGYELGANMELADGTSNEECSVWLQQQVIDLLLLPFHQHRDEKGDVLDGLQVAGLLPIDWRFPILMPVSSFSWAASFQRRLNELQTQRPEIATKIIPMREEQIGSAEIRTRLLACQR